MVTMMKSLQKQFTLNEGKKQYEPWHFMLQILMIFGFTARSAAATDAARQQTRQGSRATGKATDRATDRATGNGQGGQGEQGRAGHS